MRGLWMSAVAMGCWVVAGSAFAAEVRRVTVEQALAEAIENNLSLMAERVNIAIAEARVITARLRPNPVFSGGGDHLDLLGTGFNEVNGAGPSEFNLRTDFIHERGGKRRRRIEVAEGERGVAELEFLNAVRGLRLEVQNAFVDLLLAQENLALARQNLEMLNRIVEVNAVRWRAGEVAEVELIRSRLAALEQSNAVRRAEIARRSAAIKLQQLMGRKVLTAELEAAGELPRVGDAPSLEELQRRALEMRPDLRAQRRDSERALAAWKLELARGKVDFTFGTEYRRQQGINGTGNMLGFFFSAPIPLFDRNQGEIARARAELQRAELRVRALEAAIIAELQSAYEQLMASRALVEEIEKRMLGEASQVREITEYSYRLGEATLLEFLDAQRAFNETMRAYNEARAEYARSLYLVEAVAALGVAR